MTTNDQVLSVSNLRKVYGRTAAVDGVSFDVGRNEIVGLLGPNGAGKTTTINMILGVLEPSSGTVRIVGEDISTRRSQALQYTNFAAAHAPLPGNLSVYQNLRVFGLLYAVKDLSERIREVMEQFDLAAFRDVKCGVLSSGEQTRVSLAKAMLNRPRLLLLDEPTASLDPAAAHDVREKIRMLASEGTEGVLWTSHNMHEVEVVCDRVLFLHQGKILIQGDPKTLPREHGKETLEELFIAVARDPFALRDPLTTGLSDISGRPGRAFRSDSDRSGPEAPVTGRRKIMRFSAVAAIVLRHFYLLRGSTARILPLFAWVAIDMVLWGFISRYLNSITSTGFDFISAFLGAVLLWDFFTRVMQGVTMAFLEDVWTRNFLNIFASPLSIAEYVSGLVLSSIATSAVGLAVMLVLATTIFGLSFFTYGLMLAPLLLVLFLFGIALGILGSAVVLRFGPASEWFVWPIPAMLTPFAGVFYPVSTLPWWMQYGSYLLPPSYVFEAMRSIISGGAVSGSALLWGSGLAAAYVLLACRVFTWVYRHAVRSGLIARYSAESVT